jgi:hypothetical protein
MLKSNGYIVVGRNLKRHIMHKEMYSALYVGPKIYS